MASSAGRQARIGCNQCLGIAVCPRCQECFYQTHFSEHREALARQMTHISQEYDVFQRNLLRDNITVADIDQWEERSIKKIKAMALKARVNLQHRLLTQDQITTSFDQPTNDLQSHRTENDYTEIELDKSMEQFQQIRTLSGKLVHIEISNNENYDQLESHTDSSRKCFEQKSNLELNFTMFFSSVDDASPNRLKVKNAIHNDSSFIGLSSEKMSELQMSRGDIVFVKGNKHHETLGKVVSHELCPNDCLNITRVLQKNIGVRAGDLVLIRSCRDIKYGKRIHVKPINYNNEKNRVNLYEVYLRPYFADGSRPICKDDTFVVSAEGRTMEFHVVKTDPSPYCIVSLDTKIVCEGQTLQIAKSGLKKRWHY